MIVPEETRPLIIYLLVILASLIGYKRAKLKDSIDKDKYRNTFHW